MKAIIIALFLYCAAGPPDHAIYVSRLEDCDRMGPEIARSVSIMSEGSPSFMCLYAEEPPPDDLCWP